jgi:uncharacterized protein
MRLTAKIDSLDWSAAHARLNEDGFAEFPDVLSPGTCGQIARLYYDGNIRFRSHINMARHNFGRGEYKYFDYPLPEPVAELRRAFYPHLAMIANMWADFLQTGKRWPDTHAQFIEACHQAGQLRPTPLLLKYSEGDYNCLHQDLYGDIHFPFQVIIQLSPREDYEGGELVLVEQRPRMQSRPIVLSLGQGSVVIVPVRDRPVKGARGWRRNQMRHGVSAVTGGTRRTLGLIFHDAT